MTEHVIPALTNRAPEPIKGPRTCLTCPSFTREDEGKAGFCRTKRQPLNLEGWDAEIEAKALQDQAARCEFYGKINLPSPTSMNSEEFDELERKRTPIIFPISATTATKRERRTRSYTSLVNCESCQFFIPKRELENITGKDALPRAISGACSVTGLPIQKGLEPKTARECFYFSGGEFPAGGGFGLTLMPEYNSTHIAKRIAATSGGKVKTSAVTAFDPVTFESEVPLTTEDRENGIRAWVGIADSKTTNKIYLPIFRRDFFPPEEQVKIPNSTDESLPADYVDHSGLVFKIAVAWMELDETPALVGEAGTGKTELLRHMAWIMQLPFERITITASSEIDDLAGKFLFENGETVFEQGRLTRAWGKPNVICLDEPNTGPNDVLQFLRPLIDNSKQLVLDQNKGEQIKRNDSCFLGLAMNPAHDYRNIGTNQLADADNSRLFHLETPLPPEDAERAIIKARLKSKDNWEIPNKILDPVMAIAKTLRKMSKEGEVPFSWGIRVQIKVARSLRWFDFNDSYLIAMGSSVDEETRQKIMAVVRANTPNR